MNRLRNRDCAPGKFVVLREVLSLPGATGWAPGPPSTTPTPTCPVQGWAYPRTSQLTYQMLIPGYYLRFMCSRWPYLEGDHCSPNQRPDGGSILLLRIPHDRRMLPRQDESHGARRYPSSAQKPASGVLTSGVSLSRSGQDRRLGHEHHRGPVR
eukprot:2578783-Rhodomonas_salina.8